MGLYRMEKENGGEMYLEISDPPGLTDEQKESMVEDVVYVCTRTPYKTSMFGQIESCGFVDRAKLKPLDASKKKDAKIIQEIQDVRNEVMMKHYWHREGNSITAIGTGRRYGSMKSNPKSDDRQPAGPLSW